MIINETVRNAIKKMMEANGIKTRGLAKIAGVSGPSASCWVNGKSQTIRDENWQRLEPHLRRYLPVGPAALSGYQPPPGFPTVDMVEFPVVSMAAAAEHNPAIMPIADFLSEYSEDKIMFPVGMGREGDFAIRICGDSMQPWYPSGTVVLVRPGKPSTGDKVVAILGGGEVVFKYYVDNGDSFVLAPENDHGHAITVKKSEFGAVRSMFRVVCSMRNELDVQKGAKAEGRAQSWEKYQKRGAEI